MLSSHCAQTYTNADTNYYHVLPSPCRWCSEGATSVYHNGSCPRVKSMEYYQDGSLKRVEFKDEPRVIDETEYVKPFEITTHNGDPIQWSWTADA